MSSKQRYFITVRSSWYWFSFIGRTDKPLGYNSVGIQPPRISCPTSCYRSLCNVVRWLVVFTRNVCILMLVTLTALDPSPLSRSLYVVCFQRGPMLLDLRINLQIKTLSECLVSSDLKTKFLSSKRHNRCRVCLFFFLIEDQFHGLYKNFWRNQICGQGFLR